MDRNAALRAKWRELRERQDADCGYQRRIKGKYWREWEEFVKPFDITIRRAKEIVKGDSPPAYRPFSAKHAMACIKYLERHGYKVVKKGK
jgi:hypothetical protein